MDFYISESNFKFELRKYDSFSHFPSELLYGLVWVQVTTV